MFKNNRNCAGQTAIIITLAVVALIVILGLFLLNYSGLLVGQRQAQRAIDAAALQAAKDMVRVVVVDDNFGLVGLVDDVAPALLDPAKPEKRPVLGVGTIFATIRLDLIIAKKLENKAMVALCRDDFEKAKRASSKLKDVLVKTLQQGERARDKDGNPVDITASAIKAYQENSARLKQGELVPGTLKVLFGRLKSGRGETNLPVPQPLDCNSEFTSLPPDAYMVGSGPNRLYKAYVKIPTAGLDFEFPALGSQVTLLPNDDFVALGDDDYLPPSVVQVQADARVTRVASAPQGEKGERPTDVVHTVATAQGGGGRQTFPSGTLLVGFRSGIPANGFIKFDTIKDIINSVQLPDEQISTASSGWNGDGPGGGAPSGKGLWFQAKEGPYAPVSGNCGTLSPSIYRGRPNDDPGFALASMIHDWLLTLYLRPNVDSVVKAMTSNLRQLAGQGQGGAQPAADQEDDANLYRVFSSMAKRPVNAFVDPRSFTNTDPGAQKGLCEQYLAAFGGIDFNTGVYNQRAWQFKLDANGAPVGMDGGPLFCEMAQFFGNVAGYATVLKGNKQMIKVLEPQLGGRKAFRMFKENTQKTESGLLSLMRNLGPLSASPSTFLSMQPASGPPTREQLEKDAPQPEGPVDVQDGRRWLGPMSLFPNLPAQAVVAAKENRGSMLPAAHSFNFNSSPCPPPPPPPARPPIEYNFEPKQVPPQPPAPVPPPPPPPPPPVKDVRLIYSFNVKGDAAQPPGGEILLNILEKSPFAPMATLQGQLVYQALNALAVMVEPSSCQGQGGDMQVQRGGKVQPFGAGARTSFRNARQDVRIRGKRICEIVAEAYTKSIGGTMQRNDDGRFRTAQYLPGRHLLHAQGGGGVLW